MTRVLDFLHSLVLNRELIYQLTKRDILAQYRTSRLGILWAIIEPTAYMSLIAIVFDFGLRAGNLMEVSFTAYLLSGMSIFLLASAVMDQSSTIIGQYAFLLNKVNFQVAILPIVKILSQTVTHFFTLIPVIIILMFLDISISWYWLQSFYYLGCLIFLLLGFTLLVSALGVLIPDVHNIVSIHNRFLLYLSPIFWDISVFPPKIQTVMKLNPLYYIVSGYRDSLLFHKGFWHHPGQTLYFWSFSFIVLIIGALVFRKIKPFFSDYV